MSAARFYTASPPDCRASSGEGFGQFVDVARPSAKADMSMPAAAVYCAASSRCGPARTDCGPENDDTPRHRDLAGVTAYGLGTEHHRRHCTGDDGRLTARSRSAKAPSPGRLPLRWNAQPAAGIDAERDRRAPAQRPKTRGLEKGDSIPVAGSSTPRPGSVRSRPYRYTGGINHQTPALR